MRADSEERTRFSFALCVGAAILAGLALIVSAVMGTLGGKS